MTRARGRNALSWRPSSRPSGRGHLALVALAASLALAACGSATVSSSTPASVTGTASPAGSSPAGSTGESALPTDSTDPTLPTPAATAPGPATATPGTSGGGDGPAAACSGSDQNRSFFSSAAAELPWDVYCAVLPDPWFVEAGSFRLGGGGTLRIAYNGPDGSRLELREGAICPEASACRPSGQDGGVARFGDRQGTLIVLEGGGYAVVVDPGSPASWLAIGANVDEGTFRDLAASFHHVIP